jgi:hypothetical protein|tara:strand:+ start:272 stop:382 length:111 start_codon:yes stop_codon:yes gene_type:complete
MTQALTLKQIQKIIQAAMTQSYELNLAPFNVVVLDD